jgi:uncharacterized membrane protein YGL010W
MKEIDRYFEHYGESHRNRVNKTIHWLAVPAIFFSMLGLIWSIPVPPSLQFTPYFNWASVAIALVLYYYYRFSPAIAFGMLLVIFIMSYLIVQIEQSGASLWRVCIWLFVIAWAFQFIGHKIERKKPSFLEDIRYLLIGPAWLLHFIYRKLGLKY